MKCGDASLQGGAGRRLLLEQPPDCAIYRPDADELSEIAALVLVDGALQLDGSEAICVGGDPRSVGPESHSGM